MSDFAKKLRELRKRRNETQPDVAKLLGVKARQVQRYESDEENLLPSIPNIQKLSLHYKYDFFRLLSPFQFPDDDVSGEELLAAHKATIKALQEAVEQLKARLNQKGS